MALGLLLLAATPAMAETPSDRLAAGIAAYEAEDYERARVLLEPLAEDGAPRALYLMGDMHWAGRGGDQNFAAARDHLTRAAEGAAKAKPQDPYTYREAVHRIGYLYDFGEGTMQSVVVAECLYRIGAEMGNPLSQWNMANIIRDKPGLDPESLHWRERAAAQGDPVALGFLGYITSINPYEDAAKGLMMMMVASELGDPYATQRLAEAEALVADDVVELLHRARLMKPKWRASPEHPPAKFNPEHVRCIKKKLQHPD